MHAIATAATLALLLVGHAAEAKLYKWVDESGNVTYSQTRPPDAPAEAVELRGVQSVTDEQARERLEALTDRADTARKDREFKRNYTSETAEREARIKANCETARQNLRVLQNAPRVKADDGSFLDDTQRAAQLQKSQQQVEDFCN